MTQNSKHIVSSPPLSYILSVFLLKRKETKHFFETGLKNYRKKIQKQIFESNISSHFQCPVALLIDCHLGKETGKKMCSVWDRINSQEKKTRWKMNFLATLRISNFLLKVYSTTYSCEHSHLLLPTRRKTIHF